MTCHCSECPCQYLQLQQCIMVLLFVMIDTSKYLHIVDHALDSVFLHISQFAPCISDSHSQVPCIASHILRIEHDEWWFTEVQHGIGFTALIMQSDVHFGLKMHVCRCCTASASLSLIASQQLWKRIKQTWLIWAQSSRIANSTGVNCLHFNSE